jgi:hypothetical protein
MRPEASFWSQSSQFSWSDFSRDVQAMILLAREQSRRLRQCSIPGCRKVRTMHGALVHPALRRIEPPEGLRAISYCLCLAHRQTSDLELCELLLPQWRGYL